MQYRTSPRFPAILSSFILFLSTDVNRIIYVVPEFFLQFLYSICFSADFPRIIYTNINTCFTSGAEEMVGKKVMVVTNLKPAKLAGILSEGMILCAEDADGNLSLMVPEKEMPAGAEIC